MKKSALFLGAIAVASFAVIPRANADERGPGDGCRIGLQTSYVTTEITFPNGQPSQDLSGFMAGPVAGCSMQFDSGLVLGANGRALFGSVDDYQQDGTELDQTGTSDFMASLMLEVGWAVSDDAYVFVEGGHTWYANEQSEDCPPPSTAPFGWCRAANGYSPYNLSQRQIEDGWAAGIGGRILLSPNWALGGRYTRHMLEGGDFNLGNGANGLPLPTKHVEAHDADEFTFDLTYRW